jgi:diguanylate cyclase (GGDEF)-like protein/PAS domain S-box-containing protein
MVLSPPINTEEIHNIFSSVTSLLLEINEQGFIQRIFPSGFRFTFFSKEDLLGKSLSDLLTSSDSQHVAHKMQQVLKMDSHETTELCYYHQATCQSKWFHVSLSKFTQQSILAILQDITSLKRTQDELAQREHYYLSLINNSSDLITLIDDQGTILFECPAVEKILGYRPEEIIGTSFLSHMHPNDLNIWHSHLFTPDEQFPFPFEFRRKDTEGNWLYFEGIASNLTEDKAINGIIINSRNITERKNFELERQRHFFEDLLTGLANRTRLIDRIHQALQRIHRLKSHRFALILANMDRFKIINESLGHELADKLLQKIGTLLKEHFRKVDTIARIGGDEFALFLDSVTDDADPLRVAERLIQELRQTFTIEGYEITTSVSVGIVYSSGTYTNPDQILRDATTALHKAKATPATSYRVFQSHMHEQALKKLKMESDLRKALDNLDFEIHYQPIFDLSSLRLFGLEALIRWNHPQKGMIPPLHFIPLAEETGLIVPIGKWVLTEACAQLQKIQERRENVFPLVLCVNISAKQLTEHDLNTTIHNILTQTQYNPAFLELEITESALINNITHASHILEQLKQTGVKLSIDDFGTGYSSLSYLHNLPFDTLKIDRSFVSSLNGSTGKNETIIQSIMSLATNLKMKVIAEGIENNAQIEKMRNYSCHYAQGFFLGRPQNMKDMLQNGILKT